MKFFIGLIFFILSTFTCFGQNFSLQDAINIALENNYDIKKQRYALAIAQARFRQTKGSFDIEAGAQARYAMKQDPVDENDPNYNFGYSWLNPSQNYGIYLDNTVTEQTGGSIFLKKLFSFGLEAKLSYTVQRQKNRPNYSYSSAYDSTKLPKYEQEDGRNTGEVALELSLPLFKSFKNSLAALQLESAKDYIEQMEFTLQDTVSKSLISVCRSYWNYFLTCKNVEQLEVLQKKIEERNNNMEALIRTGVRSRNDLLAMQVNVNENRRQLQEAKVQKNNSKTELMSSLGISDYSLINEVENPFAAMDYKSIQIPEADILTEDFFKKIEEKRTDLMALKKSVDMAMTKIKYSKADSLPDAALNFSIGTSGATYSDGPGKIASAGFMNNKGVNLQGSLGASIKLGNNTKNGALDQANAEYNAAQNDYKKASNSVAIQLSNALSKLEIYKNLVQDADEVLSLDKKLYENEQKRFEAGLITVDNLLQQDQKYLSAENSYYHTLINFMQAILDYKYCSSDLVSVDTESMFY